jgi:nitrate/TMAO reductase-like tetraheme cytochrome c subunit
MVRRRGVTTTSKALLLGAIVVLPAIVVFLATAHGMQESMTVDACGDCHVMKGHVADLRNPASDSLAAVHFKNRYIRSDQCYTCHSDYGLLGTVSAKMDGVRHMVHHVRGNYALPLKIAHPFPNVRCLECHGESQKFLKSEGHPADARPQLMSGEMPCMTCHAPAHTPKEAKR